MNIILSPHFDDAVLSLGGLLAKEGANTLVATFFAGTPPEPLVRPWDLSSGFTDSNEAMRERTNEDRRALNFLGVTDDHIRAYSHLDVQYRSPKGNTTVSESELYSSIRQEIGSLIKEFGPTPLKIFAPGLERGKIHPDHVMLKRAALGAARSFPAGITEFLFFQDLPYAMTVMDSAYPRSIGNLFMRKRPEMRDYSLLEQNVSNGSLALMPVTILLENADMKKKLAAAAFYASQIVPLGGNLLRRIERFSAGQARALSLSSPYCEVAYTASTISNESTY